MRRTRIKILVVTMLFTAIYVHQDFVYGQETVSISINPTKVESQIDEKIYGHFLEHIYHSVNGGLWGEMVWNRSFEEPVDKGRWSIKDDTIVQSTRSDNVRLVFGDKGWSDYEFSLEAQKTDGAEGFLILYGE